MYGDNEVDPIVKYYEQVFAAAASDDIKWYVDSALADGGPVLDLACGTGRIALALARAGLEVTAVDQSEGMLDVFRQKLALEEESVQHLVRIEEAAMERIELHRQFATIVCCDAFFHNLSVDAQISCLQQARRHLMSHGYLLFNIPNPSIAFLSFACSTEGQQFHHYKRGEYKLADSDDVLLVQQAHNANLTDQTVTTHLRFTRLSPQRETISTEESSWMTRFTFKYEAIHLLHRCGFEVEALLGSYDGRPVTEDSQLIFVARLTD